MSDAPVTNLSNVLVWGWDNGGVEITCDLCCEVIGAGGCDCCDNNEVSLATLVQMSRDHICKESE